MEWIINVLKDKITECNEVIERCDEHLKSLRYLPLTSDDVDRLRKDIVNKQVKYEVLIIRLERQIKQKEKV